MRRHSERGPAPSSSRLRKRMMRISAQRAIRSIRWQAIEYSLAAMKGRHVIINSLMCMTAIAVFLFAVIIVIKINVPPHIDPIIRYVSETKRDNDPLFNQDLKTVRIMVDATNSGIAILSAPWRMLEEKVILFRTDSTMESVPVENEEKWTILYYAPAYFFDTGRNGDGIVYVKSFRDIPLKFWKQRYVRLMNPPLTLRSNNGLLSHISLSLYIDIEENRHTIMDQGEIKP